MITIERRSALSYKEFINEYQKPGIAVILEDATKAWKSNMIFTPDFFRTNFGERTTWFSNKEYSVSEMLALTASGTKENPAPYPVKFNILKQLPEILEYMNPLDMNLAKPNWLNSKLLKNKLGNAMDLHIGGAGNHYSVHKDAYDVHAWLIQLYGEKEVIIFPKEQEELMYAGKGSLLESRSPIDISNPDYEKYPRFREATPVTITLKAGEVLYIPSGIWHTTMAHGQNISTIIDQVNSSNYKGWRRTVYVYKKYHNKYKAILDYCAATVIGNACKAGELLGMKF